MVVNNLIYLSNTIYFSSLIILYDYQVTRILAKQFAKKYIFLLIFDIISAKK